MKPNSGTLVVNIMNGVKAEAYEGVYQCTARNERGQPFPTILLYGQLVSPKQILIKHECLTFACYLIDIFLHFILFFLKKDL